MRLEGSTEAEGHGGLKGLCVKSCGNGEHFEFFCFGEVFLLVLMNKFINV